jgi:anti-sigma regulatory factor (Ser/Thr protein kinase)
MSCPTANMIPPDDTSGPERRPPRDLGTGLTLAVELARDPSCSLAARTWLEDELGDRLSAEALTSARLVVTELVTNAFRHGRGAIELRAELTAERLRLHVVDEGEGAVPQIREEGGGPDGGWGLQIVEALTTRWGAFEGTTHVWADLPLDR